MDDRTRGALREWQCNPGDREAFDAWWFNYLRGECTDPFEARILSSGLFYDLMDGKVDGNGNKVWIHSQTGIRMRVVPPGIARLIRGGHSRHVSCEFPFLIAERPVSYVQWVAVTGEGEDRSVGTVRWNAAAGWCSQARLRLPTHAMWIWAADSGLLAKQVSDSEHLQDNYHLLMGLDMPGVPLDLPTNAFVAIGDPDYNDTLWAGGSPADMVFNNYLVSQSVEDDFEAARKRVSEYGLNVGLRDPEPTSVTWHDRSGRERTIAPSGGPFEGAPQPSGSTAPKPHSQESTTEGRPSATIDDSLEEGGQVPEETLAEFGLSGDELVLPMFEVETFLEGVPPFRASISFYDDDYQVDMTIGVGLGYMRGNRVFRPCWR